MNIILFLMCCLACSSHFEVRPISRNVRIPSQAHSRSRLALMCSINLLGTDANRFGLATVKGTSASQISISSIRIGRWLSLSA
jgi:hypothetical protein